jgi:ABC-type uncharacterized transport system substrate-binding protein
LLGLVAFCGSFVAIGANAQQPTKLWRLGILSGEPPTESLPVVTPFLEELQKLGYTEGSNLAIERRWAEAREQKLSLLATELVRRNVDVIVAVSAASVIAAKQVTASVPIVMIINSDPIETGLVASYARPRATRGQRHRFQPHYSGFSGQTAGAVERSRARDRAGSGSLGTNTGKNP